MILSDYLTYGGLPMRFAFTNETDILKYITDIYNGIVDNVER